MAHRSKGSGRLILCVAQLRAYAVHERFQGGVYGESQRQRQEGKEEAEEAEQGQVAF